MATAQQKRTLFDRLTSIFQGRTVQPGAVQRTGKGTNPFDQSDDLRKALIDRYFTHLNYEDFDREKWYDLFDELDQHPVIASILDAYGEDATQMDIEREQSVWVEGPKKAVVEEANRLLHDVLVIEDWHIGLERDLAKYGDDFLFIDIERDKKGNPVPNKDGGIMGIKWMDPRHIERVEDPYGYLIGFIDKNNKDMVERIRKKQEITSNDVYRPWDYVHFRIMSRKSDRRKNADTNRKIYGTSLLWNARRVARQYVMLEDSLALFRLTRGIDKRVFYIDVGNQSPPEVVKTIRDYKRIFNKLVYKNPNQTATGNEYNPLQANEDIFWPVRPNSNSRVDTIPGTPNVTDIADLDFFTNVMFGSLRAPKAFFGFEGDVDARATLSNQDIRFARSVKSLQRAVKVGLMRLLQIHFSIRGVEFDSTKYKVKMVQPSALENLQRVEIIQQLIDAADRAAVLADQLGLDRELWNRHILANILGFSEDEIKKLVVPEKQEELDDFGGGGGPSRFQQGTPGESPPPSTQQPPPEKKPDAEGGEQQQESQLSQLLLNKIAEKAAQAALSGEMVLRPTGDLPGQERRKPNASVNIEETSFRSRQSDPDPDTSGEEPPAEE